MGERTQTYECQRCGVSVTRRLARGTRPKWCPGCRRHAPPSKRRTGTCAKCGAPARPDNDFCSMSCAKSGPRSRRSIARQRLAYAARGTTNRKVRVAGPCVVCRASFVRIKPNDLTCSPRCREALRQSRKKGRHTIRRTEVFERDNYICWLCDEPTDPNQPVPHPKAPTVDHITPRSHGGGHEATNLRCAHFICNSTRGDKITA